MDQKEKDIFFMKKAIQEAKFAFEKNEVPVGAVIVAQENIIARAHNLTELLNDVTAHAEMQAITSASSYLGGKYLKECTIYVTLEPVKCVLERLLGLKLVELFLVQVIPTEDIEN